MIPRGVRRRLTSGLMTGVVTALCLLAVLPLVFIFGDLIAKGASSIDWAFFVENPAPAGESGGGVANAIVGTGHLGHSVSFSGRPPSIGG